MFSLSVPRAGTGARCGQQLHIWDFKKKTRLYIFFDVYLNILHLSYKTYAENTMFIFEPAGLGGYCIPIFQLNVSCGLATFRYHIRIFLLGQSV